MSGGVGGTGVTSCLGLRREPNQRYMVGVVTSGKGERGVKRKRKESARKGCGGSHVDTRRTRRGGRRLGGGGTETSHFGEKADTRQAVDSIRSIAYGREALET